MTDEQWPQRDLDWPSEDLAQAPAGGRSEPFPTADGSPDLPAPEEPAPQEHGPHSSWELGQPQEPGLPAPPGADDLPQPSAAGDPTAPPVADYLPPAAHEYDERRPPPTPTQGPGPFSGPPPILTPRDAGPYAVALDPGGDGAGASVEQQRRAYFRPDIEGLRAVAVIAVLLFHIGLPLTSGGFVGVDVFYVISGFLITGLLLREGEATGRVDLIKFYARRMRRLLPAALVVIVATLALSAVIVSPLRLTEIAGDAAASALYVANFRFAMEATNYLAVEAPSPLLHYWTLGVEEQFYLAWPLIMLVATRLLPSRFVGAFILLLALASFALSFYWTDVAQAWAFFSPFTRAWELAAGALIAVGLLRIPRRAPRLVAPVAVIVGLALIVISVVMLSEVTPYPGVAALVPVLGAVLVIVGGVARPTRPARWLLANPVSRYMGHISYSLYLWHWPILVLIPIAIGSDELGLRIGLAWVAILIAAVSTEVIERPFRHSGVLTRRPNFSVQFGLAASVAVGVVGLVMSGAISLPASLARPDPVVLELAQARQDLPIIYRDGCHVYFDGTQPSDCAYGDLESEKVAVLWGDSHAGQWFPALERYALDQGWRMEVHTKSACSPVPVELFERQLRKVYEECSKWRSAVRRRIGRIEPEIVFVGSSRDYDLWDGASIHQVRQVYPLWEEKMTELVRMLSERAGKVVLLAETPYLNFDPIDCLADDSVSRCDPARQLSVDDQYAGIEARAAEAGGAELLSISDVVCPGLTCPVVVDGIVAYRDSQHLTGSYMERLATPIANLIEGRAPFPTPSPSPEGTSVGA